MGNAYTVDPRLGFSSNAFCVKGSCDHPAHRVNAYRERDTTWCERELGDVPYRADAVVYGGPLIPFMRVPVESLGRDA